MILFVGLKTANFLPEMGAVGQKRLKTSIVDSSTFEYINTTYLSLELRLGRIRTAIC